jgi:ElaB/YqjD/DUF883 family membrane-anchored ribosome-binding protein
MKNKYEDESNLTTKPEIQDNIDRTLETLSQKVAPIKDQAQELGQNAGEWIKKHPLASAGVALGVGLLVGRAFRSSK